METVFRYVLLAISVISLLVLLRIIISLGQLIFSRKDLIREYGYPCVIYTSIFGTHRSYDRVKIANGRLVIIENRKEYFSVDLKGCKIISSGFFLPTIGKIVISVSGTNYRIFSPFWKQIYKEVMMVK